MPRRPDRANRSFLRGLARAFGGAILFTLPVLMTMEMWSLGHAIEPGRLMLMLVLALPLLIGLSHFIGFEETFGWKDDVVDALVAYAVGFVAAAPILVMFGVLTWSMPWGEIIGKVAVQAVPGSIGALLAQGQFGGEGSVRRRKEQRADTYAGETFFMAAGALFVSFNVAPTEEMVLISYQMTAAHALALVLTSLLLMHLFVYSVGFHGEAEVPHGVHGASVFLRYTVVGYAICLLISGYMLWTFGRLAGHAFELQVLSTVVLALPAAVGAAAARLIL